LRDIRVRRGRKGCRAPEVSLVRRVLSDQRGLKVRQDPPDPSDLLVSPVKSDRSD
jgi:hypothetical protein